MADGQTNLLTSADLADFAKPDADTRIPYGDDQFQFGDLRLPSGTGPHPLVVFIHGGCWLAEFDITHSNKLTHAFAANGVASWSLEYRRIGNTGGGWPGTFEDIRRGVAHVEHIAAEHNLDKSRIIAAGHSAGGHLALWAAKQLPQLLRGVLAMAPAADLGYLHAIGVCDDAVDRLMGGAPDSLPERYQDADPVRWFSLDLPQTLLLGVHDHNWTPAGERYFRTARSRGDPVQRTEAPESGHFEMIDPDSTTWPLVLGAARELLDLED